MSKYQCDKLYINGEWVSPVESAFKEIINPATEEVIGQVCMGAEADVDIAVTAARTAFDSFSFTSIEERKTLLERIIECYQDHYDEMAIAISDEMGAPISLAKKAQAAIGLGHFKAALNALENFEFEEEIGTSQVVKEPIGVCGLITPWNWPMNQVVCKVAPALAVGCSVVLKPSEAAPLSAHLLTRILDEAGVPKGVYNMIFGRGTVVGARFSSHPDVDMVSITGSTRAGIDVAKTAANTVKRVAQELGGKSANIILEDADLEKAVTDGVMRCFNNTGQSCNAPTRMLVPAQLHDKAIEIAKQAAANVIIGDPKNEATVMGPIANLRQFSTVRELIDQAIADGTELVCGGSDYPDGIEKGYFVKPTIFANVTNDMMIAQEEVFGPVLVIMPYEDEEHAIQIANDSIYGLAGAVSSGNIDNARRVARRIRTGMVHLNSAPIDINAPFGGYKQSGNGREWGAHGFDDFLELKSIVGYSAPE